MADEPNPEDLEIADELIAERRAEAPGQTPEDMTAWQRPITAVIDVINYRAGQIIALLMVPLIFVVVFEVISRNSFSYSGTMRDSKSLARSLGLGPTLWVYDTSRMIAGVLFMAAAGYGLMRGVHIRADFLYRSWSNKTQATVDASLYLLFFIPSMIFFTVVAAEFWWLRLFPKGNDGDRQCLGAASVARAHGDAGGRIAVAAAGHPRDFSRLPQDGQRARAPVCPRPAVLRDRADLAGSGDLCAQCGAGRRMVHQRHDSAGGPRQADHRFDHAGGDAVRDLHRLPDFLHADLPGFVFGIWGVNFKLTTLLMTLNTNSTMLNDQLMAVPLFVLMGIVMEAAGLMERLFASIQMIMARVRGALFIAVLIVSTIFAAATGIVGASVTCWASWQVPR